MKNNNRKATIYTINGLNNYGNRLQLFALSRILNKMGIECNVYWPKTAVAKIKELLKYKTPLSLKYPKRKKFYDFTKKYIPKSNTVKSPISVVGSDQVWNPKFFKDKTYLIDIPSNGTIISYAASIGRETLTEEQENYFSKVLKKYHAISVREKQAKSLIQPLVHDKTVEVVLDPTLLIDKSEYRKLERKPKDIVRGEKYILCYILGGREHMQAIEEYAKEKGYKIRVFSQQQDSPYGIEEFLYLIDNAELICTDSFHACVFSFIFDRPFVAFKRTGEECYMYGRIQNLINTFKLKNREFNGGEIVKDNASVDYAFGKKLLREEQEKSIKYLKDALGDKNEA